MSPGACCRAARTLHVGENGAREWAAVLSAFGMFVCALGSPLALPTVDSERWTGREERVECAVRRRETRRTRAPGRARERASVWEDGRWGCGVTGNVQRNTPAYLDRFRSFDAHVKLREVGVKLA